MKGHPGWVPIPPGSIIAWPFSHDVHHRDVSDLTPKDRLCHDARTTFATGQVFPVFPIVQMRYSFFGQSGWRSDASQQKEILFASDRLEHRFRFLQQFAMQSLLDQEDQDFGLVILTSQELPRPHLMKLKEYVGDMLGDRAEVIPRKPSSAHRQFVRYNWANLPEEARVIQIVLDDDDALSTDYMGRIKSEARAIRDRIPESVEHFFISMSRGVSAVYRPGDTHPRMYRREVPYTNLGLALVSPAWTRTSAYGIAHKKVARTHASFVYNDLRPYYIRCVHGANDSRAMVDEKSPVPDEEMGLLVERFPLLRQVLAPEQLQIAAQ